MYVYILVQIIHTEFQYISLIEIEKELRKVKHEKKGPFVPVGSTNRDKRSSFVPVDRPGTKGHPILSRTGVPGWEIGTTGISQPGQINVFVVVIHVFPCIVVLDPLCDRSCSQQRSAAASSLLLTMDPGVQVAAAITAKHTVNRICRDNL